MYKKYTAKKGGTGFPCLLKPIRVMKYAVFLTIIFYF